MQQHKGNMISMQSDYVSLSVYQGYFGVAPVFHANQQRSFFQSDHLHATDQTICRSEKDSVTVCSCEMICPVISPPITRMHGENCWVLSVQDVEAK